MRRDYIKVILILKIVQILVEVSTWSDKKSMYCLKAACFSLFRFTNQ